MKTQGKEIDRITRLIKRYLKNEITREDLFNTLHRIIPRAKKKRFVELDQENENNT